MHKLEPPKQIILCLDCIKKQGRPRGLLYRRSATSEWYCYTCGYKGLEGQEYTKV